MISHAIILMVHLGCQLQLVLHSPVGYGAKWSVMPSHLYSKQVSAAGGIMHVAQHMTFNDQACQAM